MCMSICSVSFASNSNQAEDNVRALKKGNAERGRLEVRNAKLNQFNSGGYCYFVIIAEVNGLMDMQRPAGRFSICTNHGEVRRIGPFLGIRYGPVSHQSPVNSCQLTPPRNQSLRRERKKIYSI